MKRKISSNEATALNTPQVKLKKALALLSDIEELAKHIEDEKVMRRWVLRVAASRHETVFSVLSGRAINESLTEASPEILSYQTKVNEWFGSLAKFVGGMMTQRTSMNDKQVQAAFEKWEAENKRPVFDQ